MAHLWTYSPPNWTARLLTGDLFTLSASEEPPVRPRTADEVATGRIVLRRTTDSDGGDNWLLFAPPPPPLLETGADPEDGDDNRTLFASPGPSVWINGWPLLTGARLLRDKDEIRMEGAEPMFLSTEVLARVSAFPGGARPAFCPRCRQIIESGTPAVQCPNPSCRMWHHHTTDCQCWTYAATCAVCDQSTALDSGYRWIPEETVP
jgi:hypothetical protein